MSNPNINQDYWMAIVKSIAQASTCKVKIGTILVRDKVIVSHGFLGSISGDYHCCDTGCLDVKNNGLLGSSDSGYSCIRTIHSEMNAVLKCSVQGTDRSGWLECYTTYKPCLNCLKALLAKGVTSIVYEKDYVDKWRDIFLINTKLVININKGLYNNECM